MEESSYVPNSIPPSLVVFSQAGYGDTIRMQRPFGSQVRSATVSSEYANKSGNVFINAILIFNMHGVSSDVKVKREIPVNNVFLWYFYFYS